MRTQLSIKVCCKQFPSNTNSESNCPLFTPTKGLPFSDTPCHLLQKTWSYWNVHETNGYEIWAGHRIKRTLTDSRRSDIRACMTPRNQWLLQRSKKHNKHINKLKLSCFSIFLLLSEMDICTRGKRKARHLQFINATCLWSPPPCALSDQTLPQPEHLYRFLQFCAPEFTCTDSAHS